MEVHDFLSHGALSGLALVSVVYVLTLLARAARELRNELKRK